MIIGIGYHYVRPDFSQPHPGIFGLTPGAFRDQLAMLRTQAEFIGPDDLRAAIAGDRSMPERAWLVTFDDGLREQYEHALPVLEELGIPAFFFVNTQPLAEHRPLLVHQTHLLRSQVSSAELAQAIGQACDELGIGISAVDDAAARRQYVYDDADAARVKYLLNFGLPEGDRQRVVDWCFDRLLGWDRAQVCADLYMPVDQLQDLASRGWLGSHTHSHRPLGALSAEEAERDIRKSMDFLTQWTGRQIDAIGYPYGSRQACPAWIAEVGASLGLTLGFTMERAGIDISTAPLLLPRCAPNDLPGGSTPRWSMTQIFTTMPISTHSCPK